VKGELNMWKLTIKQNTKDSYIKDEVSFYSVNIVDLTVLIERLAGFGTDRVTTYKIEWAGEESESA
jgi:hypothetical protein